MGEKIKNLHAVTIGRTSLMIELNEGYSAAQGRLIHIQNEKFRYLLKEKDFLHLASIIMRGWSEFEYIKTKPATTKAPDSFRDRNCISEDTLKASDELRTLFSDLRFRFLDLQEGLITVLVHPDCAARAGDLLKSHDWKERAHPYGTDAGYSFLYQMTPFRLFGKGSRYIELFSQLPCASLTKNMWIPMDRSIQQFLWSEEAGPEPGCWANIPCQFLYHLCWAVFFRRGFSPYEIRFIKQNQACVDTPQMRELLTPLFFGFTDRLIRLICDGSLDKIIPEYFSFREY